MNKFKKVLVTFVAAITAMSGAATFASCGGGVTGDVEVVAYDGSKVKITFSHCMGGTLQAAVERYLPKFNELYPNIEVVIEKGATDYDTLLDTISNRLNGDEEFIPSVAYCYPDHVASYNRGKKVVALDPYIASTDKVAGSDEAMGFSEEQINDFYSIFYNEGKQYGDGKMYSLPFYKSSELLYYNETFFEQNNLKVPTTWDEMEEVCAQIKAIDSNCIPLGYDSESNWFITMTEQLGSGYTSATGDYFRFNNQTNVDFVAEIADWYQKGYVTTQEINSKQYSSVMFQVLDTKDQNNLNCYMCIGSTGGAAYQTPEKIDLGNGDEYPFKIGVAQIPQANPEAPKVIQQGPSICVFKKSNPQEVAAAWLFAKFYTSNAEFQADSSLTNGYTPVVKSALEHPVYKSAVADLEAAQGKEKNSYLQVAVVQQTLTQMDTYFTSAVFKGSSKARKAVGSLMQNCLVNAKGSKDYIQQQFDAAIKDLEYTYGKSAD